MKKGKEVGKQRMCSRNAELSTLVRRIWRIYPIMETGLLKEFTEQVIFKFNLLLKSF